MKLKELGDYYIGLTYKPESVSDDGTIVLRSGNIQNGKFDLNDIVRVKANIREKQYVKPGDILMCSRNGSANLVGKSTIIPNISEPMTFGAFMTIFRTPYNRYLSLFLKSKSFRRQLANSKTTTINQITINMLDNIEIDLPGMAVQEERCYKLEALQKIIDSRYEQLKKLDDLIKARFVEMFGTFDNPARDYEKATLKELCNKITDGKHGGCSQEEGTERYFVGAREIFDDKVHYDTAPEINADEFEKDYKRCNVEIGDFLIVNTGATIGKSAIADDERTEHTLLQKSVALLKLKREKLNPVFLKWCYRVNTSMYLVESASAQPNLLLSKINSTVIYVPDIAIQDAFEQFVKQVDKSKSVIQKSLNETQLLYEKMMQKYFG